MLNDFKRQLLAQRGFIERSAQLYDEGFVEEFVRLAVSFRVLFHNTASSTSLLKHLGAGDILIASHMPAKEQEHYDPAKKTFAQFITGVGINEFGIVSVPRSVNAEDRYIPVDTWLSEVSFVFDGVPVTRHDLIKWAANKDGGAHVDDILPERYAQLFSAWERADDGQTFSIHEGAFRTMAYEVLGSPELWAQAD